MEEESLPVEEVKKEESLSKTALAILATATLIVGGGYAITEQQKSELEAKIQMLEETKYFQVENVVDLSGVPVFESQGEVVKVIINGQEWQPSP